MLLSLRHSEFTTPPTLSSNSTFGTEFRVRSTHLFVSNINNSDVLGVVTQFPDIFGLQYQTDFRIGFGRGVVGVSVNGILLVNCWNITDNTSLPMAITIETQEVVKLFPEDPSQALLSAVPLPNMPNLALLTTVGPYNGISYWSASISIHFIKHLSLIVPFQAHKWKPIGYLLHRQLSKWLGPSKQLLGQSRHNDIYFQCKAANQRPTKIQLRDILYSLA